MAESKKAWVRTSTIEGGWVVACRLCGKGASRTFHGSMTNYAEALRAADEYHASHYSSPAHMAAMDAYYAPSEEPRRATREEALLAEIFGIEPETEEQLRRRAAKSAARRAARTVGREAFVETTS